MASTIFRSWTTRVVVVASLCLPVPAVAAPPSPADLAQAYVARVDRPLQVPAEEVVRYAQLAEEALARASIRVEQAQYLAVVDRDATVQALLLFWRSADGRYELVGASPVSPGSPGSFDHFATPQGVFAHGPWNPDFRAEGTFNSNGIRGYGLKGMRVYARDTAVDSGRYLVVVDSAREERPPWSPAPVLHHRRPPQ